MKKIYSYNQTININGKDYGKASINIFFLMKKKKIPQLNMKVLKNYIMMQKKEKLLTHIAVLPFSKKEEQ